MTRSSAMEDPMSEKKKIVRVLRLVEFVGEEGAVTRQSQR